MTKPSDIPIRVLLTEHQTLVRIGIKTILNAAGDFEIVGEAETGAKGFELFQQLNPDVTILSCERPIRARLIRWTIILQTNKKAKIIVLADTAGDAEISKALKKGALGYICKDVAPDELTKAIRTVNAGRKFIPNYIANVLSENIGQEELTKSEQRILQMIVGGMSNKEIAFALDISATRSRLTLKISSTRSACPIGLPPQL